MPAESSEKTEADAHVKAADARVDAAALRAKESRMISNRTITLSLLGLLLWSSLLTAQDLSEYRGFSFGMTPESVAKQAGMNPTAIKTIHERPELIQELFWTSQGSDNSRGRDSVGSIRFTFYNSRLYRMTVTYNLSQVGGLTVEDVIDAISAQYGASTNPQANIEVSSSTGYESSEKVLARWDDSEYSYDLFRPSYRNTFGLVLVFKRLDLTAAAAVREAQRLDKIEAPEKEIIRKQKQDDIDRAAQEKDRSINKPKFRP